MPSSHPTAYYQELLRRYLADELSQEEVQELLHYIQASEQGAAAIAADRYDSFEQQLQSAPWLPAATSARMHQRLLEAIRQPAQQQTSLPLIPSFAGRSHTRKWWMAAAVLLPVAALLALLLHQRQKPATSLAQHYQADIAPGGDKAVLTLADGSTIVLDSAGNGTLAQQGSASIVKEAGALTYQAPSAATPGHPAAIAAPRDTTVQYNTLSTPRGGQFTITLPDGTRVWLNAASSLRYPVAFTGSSRIVVLIGEAYFDVAPNAQQPFLVRTGKVILDVLGTQFNIMAYGDEPVITTTLVTGAVKVNSPNSDAWPKPGEQAAVAHDGSIQVQRANIAVNTAWKNGRFSFQGADLPVLLRQFARWYNITIETHGTLKHYAFTGEVPRTAHLSVILKLLEANSIPYRLEANKLIIQP